MVVIDASATLYLLSSNVGEQLAADLGALAPPLMWSEATSAIRSAAWRGEISHELAEGSIGRLTSLPIGLERPDDLYPEALAVAARLGWAKTYDAEYVALTRLLDTRLLTRDARLRRGASRLIEVVSPAEL